MSFVVAQFFSPLRSDKYFYVDVVTKRSWNCYVETKLFKWVNTHLNCRPHSVSEATVATEIVIKTTNIKTLVINEQVIIVFTTGVVALSLPLSLVSLIVDALTTSSK